MSKKFTSAITGAAFLMATSAIGPGFLTQTAVFTNQLAASFGFVILISILLDIGAQLNIWSVLVVSGKKAQDVANGVMPGLGHLLALLVVLGGFAFNIGNLAGTGLGLQVLTGISAEKGAAISAVIAIMIFLSGNTVKWMDIFTKVLGVVMIALTLYVCFTSEPPLMTAAYRSFVPETIDARAIITLVGGTVGGYISFAGAHRLLESGLKGKEALPEVRRSAVSGIMLASAMRILLFLAALGVITQGLILQDNNPAASVFKLAAGPVGYKLFGVVMWCAAITSVTGSAYTSFSFISTLHPRATDLRKWIISVFILVSALVFIAIGQPVKILVVVGMLNGFILPIALTVMLIAAHRLKRNGYHHPLWLTVFGVVVIVATSLLSIKAVMGS
ncbi:MAG TPA: NRAMP family divalent metal transporter [Chitinophagaceae bacterium]|nr:NRAMP family divalent metal transporter [Chitinophagaceae bacterium]